MKSNMFLRALGRSDPPGQTPAENPTPVSVNESEVYFDNTPRNPSGNDNLGNNDNPMTMSPDDGSRPTPTNPDNPVSSYRKKSSKGGLEVDVNTFWSAGEEFDRQYDLTPVSDESNNGGGFHENDLVGQWDKHGRPLERGNSTGR